MFTLRTLLLLLLVSAALLGSHLSCKKTPTEPPNGNGPKDPRTYTWTVDTITYPGSFQTAMRSIWASGPDNAYIVGHNDRAFGKMFYFDGTQWTDVRLNVSQGGTISPPVDELSKVFGFAPNNIFAVGGRYGDPPMSRDSSVVIHFDGVQWREQSISPRRGRHLQSLWGASPTDIWAGGVNTLLHYDGVQWSHFPIEMPGQGIQFLSIAGMSASEVYMVGGMQDATGNNDTVAYILYQFDGTSWTAIDSSISVLGSPPHRFGGIINTVDGNLFSVGHGVFKRENANWLRLHTITWPLAAIGGVSRVNIFVCGTESQIWHYNSLDWYRYPEFSGLSTTFASIWTNEEQVFIVGNDGFRTFVARGK